jgi:hypothetical protein
LISPSPAATLWSATVSTSVGGLVAAEPTPDLVVPPRVPAYAWDWLQRSRPVVDALASVLTGRPPRPGFVQAVRRSFASDDLVRDAVFAVVAEVAFRGRVPTSRPPGVSWDRGLVWWAATLSGRSVADYEDHGEIVDQPRLFDAQPAPLPDGRALLRALRELVAHADGDQIPVAAVRQLIAQLERHALGDDVR